MRQRLIIAPMSKWAQVNAMFAEASFVQLLVLTSKVDELLRELRESRTS